MSSKPNIENSPNVPCGPLCDGPEAIAQMPAITSAGGRAGAGQMNEQSWRFNRQISVSVLVQLVLLASLIVGSWVNLQRQLDLLQRDVTYLCECQKNVERKLELLHEKSISYEYRLRAVEK
ncbi:MAG TPA: hypothetical protein VMW16_04925 [Sedimentisphaerales bacterium]|nr:hypothetical protein [Sedimentisphaerales bacterium]